MFSSSLDTYVSMSASPCGSNQSAIESLSSAKYEYKIDLIYNPQKSTTHHSPPPKFIKIRPRLQAINLQSTTPIPITIDPKFLMESTTTQSLDLKINSVKWKFLNHLKTWKSISQECKKKGLEYHIQMPKQLYCDALSLVRLQLSSPGDVFDVGCNGVGIGGIDLFQDVEIGLKIDDSEIRSSNDDDGEKEFVWKREVAEESGYVYCARATFGLFLDESKLLKRNSGTEFRYGTGVGFGQENTTSPLANSFNVTSKYLDSGSDSKNFEIFEDGLDVKNKKTEGSIHLVPTFQTCHLSRFYNVKFEIECGLGTTGGKSKKKLNGKDGRRLLVSLPIDIV
ncbi:unnamed protein product [Ambrosiozyma monospora]|uniref:Unnamed protein product n=1 Tax=Ambrosiozyma monospora TaxID=43982 RepID=A0ACB5T410_AMBMO|nr:unnamed protein product [Ambrosiozyma monospora]